MRILFLAAAAVSGVMAATVRVPLEGGLPEGFVAEAFAGGAGPQGGKFTANPKRKGVAPDGNSYWRENFAAAKAGTFTAQAFVKAKAAGTFAHVMTQRRGNDYGSSWSISVSPEGNLCARFDLQRDGDAERAGFNTSLGTAARVDDGRWHHVALAVDGAAKTARLYCDYEEVGALGIGDGLKYAGGKFRIGQGLDGELRGVRIDDAVLGPDEFECGAWFVRARAEKGGGGGPVAYDDTYTRVQSGVRPGLKRIGALIPKKTGEAGTSKWSVGCECLDRNLASWDAYKSYLPLLGIKKIRLQGGWGRTERERGKYDFRWLDKIVDEAHAMGLEVCMETSYRNKLYGGRKAHGGPGPDPLWGWSEDEKAGWDRWVEEMAKRYTARGVNEWMAYNEPNLGFGKLTAEERAKRWDAILENNLRTAATIKRVNPKAKFAAFVLAGLNYANITNMLAKAKAQGKIGLLDYAVFHGYSLNPDALDNGVKELAGWLKENAPHMKAWQGEAGCASEEVQYAMNGVAWTEYSQAKWNARRMLCDIACGADSLLFAFSDLSYNKNFISRYGLLKTRPDNSIIKVKTAFYTAQNIVSVFNDGLELVDGGAAEFAELKDARKRVGSALFRDRKTGEHVLALWDGSGAPAENRELTECTVSVAGGRMTDPVWLNLIDGQAWELPAERVERGADGRLTIRGVPYYDGPSAIVPRGLLNLEPPKSYRKRAAPGL